MATYSTEVPPSPTITKGRAGSDSLEAEAIGLEVPVRVHGSQVTSVLDATEHAEPFEEDTSTMIVFPRGAVVKLRAHVRTGHAIVLTNLLSRKETLGKVIQVNSAGKTVHYVKLEFVHATPGFWGVHFPSDPLPSERNHASSAPAPDPAATPAPIFSSPIVEKPAATIPAVAPAPSQNSANTVAAPPVTPNISTAKPLAPMSAGAPTAPQISKPIPPSPISPKPAPKSNGSPVATSAEKQGYTASVLGLDSNLEPLAATSTTGLPAQLPASLAEKAFAPSKPAPSVAPPANRKSRGANAHAKKVDTDKLPFSNPSSQSKAPAFRPTSPLERSFGQGLSLRSAEAETEIEISPEKSGKSGSKLVFTLVAVCGISLVAAGAFLYRHPGFRLHFPKFANTSGSAATPQAQNPPTANASAPTADEATAANSSGTTGPNAADPAKRAASESGGTARSDSPAVTIPAGHSAASPVFVRGSEAENVKRPAARSETARADASESTKRAAVDKPAGGKSFADLLPGDLNVQPQLTRRAVEKQEAPVPQIQSDVPPDDSGSSANSALGGLVGGNAAANLPAPPKPAPAIRAGGKFVPPQLIASTPPYYPSVARANHVEGVVSIQAQIDKTGKITSMKVVSGPMLLRNAALMALRQWKYAPAKLDGQTIATQYLVKIRFVLNGQ